MEQFLENLKTLEEKLNLKRYEFAEKLGFSPGYVSGVFTQRKKPGADFRLAVLDLWAKTFPESQEKENVSDTPVSLTDQGYRKVPVVSWARAGAAADFADMCNQLETFVLTRTPDPSAFGLIIEGDSMEPEARAGDMAVVSPTSEPRNGGLVIARLNEGSVYFKRFYREGKEGQTVRLVSTNKNYADLVRNRSDFRFIYRVVTLVRDGL